MECLTHSIIIQIKYLQSLLQQAMDSYTANPNSRFHSKYQTNNADPYDVKNQYSTFMEELQSTTEKLMNQVFNKEYQPDIGPADLHIHLNKITEANAQFHQHNKKPHFEEFITRNRKWWERKNHNLNINRTKIIQEESKQLTLIPKILRGSKQKLQPIYERTLEVHGSKEKALAFKRVEQKRKEEQQFNKCTFHPKINKKQRTRTFYEYVKDKEQWNKRKLEAQELRKLNSEAQKYSECTFAPQLSSNHPLSQIKNENTEKVEDRLLRTLEKAYVVKIQES